MYFYRLVAGRFTKATKAGIPLPEQILEVFKGYQFIFACRAFVEYIYSVRVWPPNTNKAIHTEANQPDWEVGGVVHKFLHWCNHTTHPNEHFFNTLNYMPSLRAPGGYTGIRNTNHLYIESIF